MGPAAALVAAHRDALRDAEASLNATEARILWTTEQIADARRAATSAATAADENCTPSALTGRIGHACRSRLDERRLKQQASRDDTRLLRVRADDRTTTLGMHRAGLAARETRLVLSRQCLHEHAQKIEVLRARGGVAEELLRARSFQLGVASERLRERRQQLGDLTRRQLELRVRLGISKWLPQHLCAEALASWHAALTARRANRERQGGAVAKGRRTALQRALSVWRAESAPAGDTLAKPLVVS
eukprot:6763938-Prymnesium_polylepis.1